ncbi:MAG: hypothetical protein ABFE07_00345 [Armatimonadia bacterium]
MNIDIDAIEQAALAVGPEQWFGDGTGTIYLCHSDPALGPEKAGQEVVEVYLRTDCKDGQRQRFIAAANPAAVLELVQRLRNAEAAIQLAKAVIEEDRKALIDSHTAPGTGDLDSIAHKPLARYNAALSAIAKVLP